MFNETGEREGERVCARDGDENVNEMFERMVGNETKGRLKGKEEVWALQTKINVCWNSKGRRGGGKWGGGARRF